MERKAEYKINYLSQFEINRRKWDHCVRNSRQGLIYGFSWYLDLVSESWDALVLDDYRAVMPLPFKKKAGFRYIYQPLLTQQLGVFSRIFPDKDLTRKFISSIPGTYRLIDYNLNYLHQLRETGLKYSARTNFELRLNSSYEAIEKGFSENTRRNIQKSILQNEPIENISVQEFISLKRKVQESKRSREYYIWLNTYIYKLLQTGRGRMIGVRQSGDLIAALFYVISMNRIYYLLPVSDNNGKKNRSMFAVIDHLLGKYADTGLVFDFEGSDIQGVARFFSGFGAEKKEYWGIQINNLPWPLNYLKN